MAGEERFSNRRITRSMTANTKRAAAAAAAKGNDEKSAPAKKKVQLPQEDVDSILSRPRVLELPRYIKDLKRQNPDLIPSPEEATDAETMELYEEARLFSDSAEAYREFQASFRSEYARFGYVMVEDDYLDKVEEARPSLAEFKAELEQDMDDDLKKLFKT